MGHLRRLIVFDLDGTLIDSRRDLADAANALIVERGGAPLSEAAIGRMVGEGAAVLVRRALTAAGLPMDDGSLPRFLTLYDERLLNHTRPYAGIVEALDLIAPSAAIAVLTNKPLAPSERLLEALGLDRHVAATLGGDSAFARKPDPAALRHLMDRFGAGGDATVMVGDSWVDCETARNAGARVCLARYGFGFDTFPLERLRGDEACADEPAQIPALVDALLAGPPRGPHQ